MIDIDTLCNKVTYVERWPLKLRRTALLLFPISIPLFLFVVFTMTVVLVIPVLLFRIAAFLWGKDED